MAILLPSANSRRDGVSFKRKYVHVELFKRLVNLAQEKVWLVQGSYASGKFKIFQGQGIVREFYVVSVKNECLLKCQGNVREFYNFQLVSNDEKQKWLVQFS